MQRPPPPPDDGAADPLYSLNDHVQEDDDIVARMAELEKDDLPPFSQKNVGGTMHQYPWQTLFFSTHQNNNQISTENHLNHYHHDDKTLSKAKEGHSGVDTGPVSGMLQSVALDSQVLPPLHPQNVHASRPSSPRSPLRNNVILDKPEIVQEEWIVNPLLNAASDQTPLLKNGIDTLKQPLLTTQTLLNDPNNSRRWRKPPDNHQLHQYQDPMFAAFFVISTCITAILTCIYSLSTSSETVNDVRDAFYSVLMSLLPYVSLAAVSSACLGLVYLILLRRFLKPVLWVTVFLTPVVWLGTAAAFWIRSMTSRAWWSSLFGAALLVAGIGSAIWLIWCRRRIGKAIRIIEVAVGVVGMHKKLIKLSLVLVSIYLVVFLIWSYGFTRLFLLGHVESSELQRPLKHWVPDPASNWLKVYFVFSFLWISAVFSNLERFVISAVVCDWYFHRHDLQDAAIGSHLQLGEAFRRGTSYQFGSICFASLTVSILQTVQVIVRNLQKITRNKNLGPVRLVLSLLNRVTRDTTSYALIDMSYSGSSFISATRRTGALFQYDGILLTTLANSILYTLCFTTALLTSAVSISILTRVTNASAIVLGPVTVVIPFWLCKLCGTVVIQVVDALYVCCVWDENGEVGEDGNGVEIVRKAFGEEELMKQQNARVNSV